MAQPLIDGLPRAVALGGLLGRKAPATPRQVQLLKMFDALSFARQAPFRQSQDDPLPARAIEAAYAEQMRETPKRNPNDAVMGVRGSVENILRDTTGSDLA